MDFPLGGTTPGFDPWYGDVTQSMRLKARCKILVAGVDVTSRLDPHLESVHVLDMGSPYNCEVELDDRDGRIPMPPLNSPLVVELGWANEETEMVYNGTIMDVESGFSRKAGGRKLWVRAAGANPLTQIKAPMQNHWGEGAPPGQEQGQMIPFQTAAQEVVRSFGGTIEMHQDIANIMRDYWHQGNESGLHWLERHAREFGAWVGVVGNNHVIIAKPGQNSDGGSSGSVLCQWGVNLIAWRIHPILGRTTWSGSTQQFFSTNDGVWKFLKKNFGFSLPWSDANAVYSLPSPAPNSGVADQHNQGSEETGSWASGTGRIAINGEPGAHFNMTATLKGARPGVDGSYWIKCAEHVYSRQGYVTWLDVVVNGGDTSTGGVGAGWTGGANS